MAENLVFRVTAFDPAVGQSNGAGVDFVEMAILDQAGNLVYSHTDRRAGYCAFGRNETGCTAWSFADQQFAWPNGQPIRPGPYLLRATVYASSGTTSQVELPIEIVL